MSLKYYDACWREHQTVAAATPNACREGFAVLLELGVTSIRAGGKIVFFGNGGSAADAQHLATELTVRFGKNRPAIPALALTTDTSALTAIGNDFDFSMLFSRQVDALVTSADLVIGISTSGKSANVINGLEAAKAKGAFVAAFSGASGGLLSGLANPLLCVPSTDTARIQEMHIALGQIFCGALEQALGYV
ncbi:MAG: SIS domain-containing protein [Holosporales bacterium]